MICAPQTADRLIIDFGHLIDGPHHGGPSRKAGAPAGSAHFTNEHRRQDADPDAVNDNCEGFHVVATFPKRGQLVSVATCTRPLNNHMTVV